MIQKGLVLIFLIFTAYSQSITFTVETELLSPQYGINNIVGSLYFYPPVNSILNTSSQTIVHWPLNNCTAYSIAIDLNNQIWCIGYNSNSKEFSVNLLNDNDLSIAASYPVNFGDQQATYLYASGDYLTFVNATFHPIDNYLMGFYTILSSFNTNTRQVVCENFSANYNEPQPDLPLYFTGEAYIYIGPVEKANANIFYQTCDGKYVVSKTDVASAEYFILGFNDSSVFLNIFSASESPYQLYARSFTFNSSGNAIFGNLLEISYIYQINDTTFVVPSNSGQNNYTCFDVYYIDESLNITLLTSYQTNILANPTEVNVNPGTTNAVFSFSEGGQFVFNFVTGEFSSVIGMTPPIEISDGTIVYITSAGVLYQEKGASLKFISLPWNGQYIDPTDPQHIYLLYIPSVQNLQTFNCSLVEINPAFSFPNQTNFPSCPLTTNSYTLKDVVNDENGNPFIAYRNTVGAISYAGTVYHYGPYNTMQVYAFPQVSLNLTTGLGFFTAAQVKPINFIVGAFRIESGNSLNWSNPSGAETLNYVCKLSEDLMLLSSTSSGVTDFQVIKVTDPINPIFHFSSRVPMPISTTVPIFALNVNPVNNPKNIFDGLVVLANGNTLPYLVSTDGSFVQVTSSYGINSLNVMPVGQDSILLTFKNNDLIYGQVVQVTNWKSSENEEIEI